jgi:hypothetical protein
MPRLSLKDLELINIVISDIYAIREPGEFIKKLIAALNNLFSSDLLSYNEFNAQFRITRLCAESTDHENFSKKHMAALNAYMPTHPGFSIANIDRCTMISDLVKPSDFKKSALYNEYYRHMDIQTQMFTELPGPSGIRPVLAFSRNRYGFTEEERLMLGLVKPHIINAYRNALEWDLYKTFSKRERPPLHFTNSALRSGRQLFLNGQPRVKPTRRSPLYSASAGGLLKNTLSAYMKSWG